MILFEEMYLTVTPALAVAIGLNEAIFLEHLLFRMNNSKHEHQGRVWVYNTYQGWVDDCFPFWSVSTLKRTIAKLEGQGLVLSGNFNKMKIDRTRWYTIDFEKLASILPVPLVQSDPTNTQSTILEGFKPSVSPSKKMNHPPTKPKPLGWTTKNGKRKPYFDNHAVSEAEYLDNLSKYGMGIIDLEDIPIDQVVSTGQIGSALTTEDLESPE